MTDSLDRMLLSGTSALFQPIFDVRGDRFEVYAVEALTRGPAGTHFEQASIFFDYVRLKREEVRVDRSCIAAALARYAALSCAARLSLNVHASTLERDASFVSFLESTTVAVDVDPSRLIIEIIEQSAYFDVARLVRVVRNLRSLGAAIAIDDVGVGHGNFRTILDTHPEYLKIDRYFVSGAAGDARRRSLIASTVRIANDFGAMVVGEGVEEAGDLCVLRDMGVPLVQGYLLATPERNPALGSIEPHFVLPFQRREA